METLAFWNRTKYASTLSTHFGVENVITSHEMFLGVADTLNTYKSLIVLCELEWTDTGATSKLQHLQGIELVKVLRRERNLKIPVLFVSFLSLPDIFNAEREIVTVIGHSYCQLPSTTKDMTHLSQWRGKLTPSELTDVQLFACNPKGIVNEKIHQIQGIVNDIETKPPSYIKNQLEIFLQEIHAVFHISPSISLNLFRYNFPSIDKANINTALAFVEEVGKELMGKYTALSGEAFIHSNFRKPWSLLMLDDELTSESEIVKSLDQKGVNVICTSNAQEAMDKLKIDNPLRSQISVLLVDYRLYENSRGIKKQQLTQGYTFLQNVGERFQSKLLSGIVYSGMPRQFLLETFKTFRIRTEIFSKIDFKLNDPIARNFIINRIIETGDSNYEAMLALPLSNKGWKNNLHNIYLFYRNQFNYEILEREICDECTEWIEKFKLGESPKSPMIKGDALAPLQKGKEAQTLEKFIAYYKTRRLAQYLNLYYENKKINDVQEIIFKTLSFPEKKDSALNIRRFFSQIIGFKKDDFPFGATIEELNWFDADLQIPVLDSYKRFRSKFSKTESLIGDFISNSKTLKTEVKASKYSYEDKRKYKLEFNPDSYAPILFDRSDFGLCMEWLGLQLNKLSRNEIEDILLLQKSLDDLWK